MPPSQHPVSQKQLAANRTNAAQSTGPRTPQGKARSAQNARQVSLETGLFTTCLMTKEPAGDGDIEITRAQNRQYLQPCGKNYRTKPFPTPNPNQMKPLSP